MSSTKAALPKRHAKAKVYTACLITAAKKTAAKADKRVAKLNLDGAGSMTPEEITGIAIALLAGSELLSLVPGIKANGWAQLVLAALKGIAAAKRR